MFNTNANHRSKQQNQEAAPRGRGFGHQGVRAAVAAILACATLVGCTSATQVVAADKPGTYTVAATATGGRMAWARAHEEAVTEARDYCERRGMQSSVTTESVSGVQTMATHASSVNFECHPKF